MFLFMNTEFSASDDKVLLHSAFEALTEMLLLNDVISADDSIVELYINDAIPMSAILVVMASHS